ncbi:hypothetical protein D2V93_15930 [Flagellimonas taeanensis]|uniref:hypothetical protein n=1 Tax=Flavobacteriaceae TaxID=49546 RepID=UPI000E696F46|nr:MULTISPECIES: hypothetical protein [Allomuricauda]MDC6383881.1 hypothetical protein [Muricauda sp. SK9]RIV48499.1 hypothetical protein D2V93_15930 [Allomuricauda taeanensis]
MSLGIVIKAPEGIVLAAESRVTLTNTDSQGNKLHVNFDNADKVLSFNGSYNNIGVVTFGAAAIGVRTAHSFIPEFETTLSDDRQLSVLEFTQSLSDFFSQQWTEAGMPDAANYQGQNMTFIVAGYNQGDAYGSVYQFDIPRAPNPRQQNPNREDFGITWGGQREIVDRMIMGYDTRAIQLLIQNGFIQPENQANVLNALRSLQLSLPIQFMPLQDCVNLAVLFIRTTIETQELTIGLRGCGGAIDVAIITKNSPLEFIKKKELSI